MRKTTRRDFLQSTAAAGGIGLLPARSTSAAGQGDDDLRFAVIGTGGRGSGHIRAFSSIEGASIVALCDADEKIVKVIEFFGELNQQTT